MCTFFLKYNIFKINSLVLPSTLVWNVTLLACHLWVRCFPISASRQWTSSA